MERNGHSHHIDSLKAKLNICVAHSFPFFFLSLYVLYVFYICLTHNVCVYFILQIYYL